MLPWNVEDLTFDATKFSGVARLFPLADLVMFPHVMQPLHIFEQRYRDLLNDALDGDGLIAMSLPAPGHETNLVGRPQLLPHVCLGKIVSHHRFDDGRYNVMLLGVHRARILRELPADRTFRRAEVELVDDEHSLGENFDRSRMQALIATRFEDALPLPEGSELEGNVREMLASEVPLGVLADLVAFALPLGTPVKQTLLAEVDVDRRAAMLISHLNRRVKESAAKKPTSPHFSTATRIQLPPAATKYPPDGFWN